MGGQRFHLVHGYPGEGHETRIWGRVEPDNRSPFPDTICIVGHTPTVFLTDGHDEDFSIWHGDGILDIDCGCGSMKAAHRRLACLRLAACREESRVFRPWQAGLTGEVAMEGADLLSIRMELREVRGDGRPLLSCSGVTWDWKAGAPVPLGMLLPERSRRRQLLEGIRQAGEWELRSGSCLLDPDWKEMARRDFRASRFCLRPEGIELFYPQCSLAPAVEGVLSFRVPLAGAAWTAGEGTASET